MFGRGGRGGSGGGFSGALYGEFKPNDEPTDLYPKVAGMPIQENVTELEQQGVAQFLQLRNEIRDGPFYLGAAPKHKDKEGNIIENMGPPSPTSDGRLSDGIKRYTDRYRERPKASKLLSEHPFLVEFFPSELHSVLGASTGVNSKVKGRGRKKKLALGSSAGGITSSDVYRQSFGQDIDADGNKAKTNGTQDHAQDRQSNLALAFAQLDENGGTGEGGDDDDAEEEDEVEDDFDDEEEGDYNAEQYFDDGNEDYDEDDGGDDEAAY